MKALLGRPSFWPEPRDPWAWQRALRKVSKHSAITDPRPVWEVALRDVLPRRSVPGLYGLKPGARQPVWLGCGLLRHTEGAWHMHTEASNLVEAPREEFQISLARWLTGHSPWLRLALLRLASGAWRMPRGTGVLQATRVLRVGEGQDLKVRAADLRAEHDANGLCAPDEVGPVTLLRTDLAARELSPLHSPLYLLHAVGWLDEGGRPVLPPDLASSLWEESPATALRRISGEEADVSGFVPVDRVARRLWTALYATSPPRDLGAWTDRVFGEAVEHGAIEVHAWAPGQPRHGRGLHGERGCKLVRWTVHDDFDPAAPTATARGADV